MQTYLQFGSNGSPSRTKLVTSKVKVNKGCQSISSKDTKWMVLNEGKWLRVKAKDNIYYVTINKEEINVTINH